MTTTAEKIISFYRSLSFKAELPPGIQIMNPMKEDRQAAGIIQAFYTKYFSDHEKRCCIMGINPGRLGGGLTGIPFTDPKRLQTECGIQYKGIQAHEPSSVFIYEMINAYGGAEAFYKKFYITAVSPLGFTAANEKGRELNYNYYDLPALQQAVGPFAESCIKKQLPFLHRQACICLGTGKNEKFIRKLNDEKQYFESIIPVEHPRFIMQYKNKEKEKYIGKYLQALEAASVQQ
jgi:hypothetical protein